MFEKTAVKLLSKHLGQYVQGLDEETLKVGVWKGDISFENLGLKTEALNALDLPFVFDSGLVRRLQIKVPWKKIKTEPVVLTIEGVYAVILPRPADDFDAKKERDSVRSEKAKAMEEAEAKLTEKQSAGDRTFAMKLAERILHNIQIVVKNVHVRFEDKKKDQICSTAMGVTLEEISFTTTDADFNPITPKNAAAVLRAGIIHKIGKLQNLAIYSEHKPPVGLPFSDFDRYISKGAAVSDMNFILRPVRASLELSVLKTDVPDLSTPKLKLTLSVEDCSTIIEPNIVQVALTVMDSAARHRLRRKWVYLRPEKGVREDVRGWWAYAINSTLATLRHSQRNTTHLSWARLFHRRLLRLEYVQLYKRLHNPRWLDQAGVDASASVKVRLQQLQDELHIHDILLYRNIAEKSLQADAKKDDALRLALEKKKLQDKFGGGGGSEKAAKVKSKFFGFVSSVKNSDIVETMRKKVGKDDDDEIEAMTSADRDELFDAIDYNPAGDAAAVQSHSKNALMNYNRMIFALQFSTGSVTVIDTKPKSHEVFKLMFALGRVSAKVRGVAGIWTAGSVDLTLDEIQLFNRDSLSKFNCLVARTPPKEGEFTRSLISLHADKSPVDNSCDLRFILSVAPITVVYDPTSIATAKRLFTRERIPGETSAGIRQLQQQAREKLESVKKKNAMRLNMVRSQRIDLNVDVDCFRALVPQSVYTTHTPMVVLTVGKLLLQSKNDNPERVDFTQTFSFGLKDVGVLLASGSALDWESSPLFTDDRDVIRKFPIEFSLSRAVHADGARQVPVIKAKGLLSRLPIVLSTSKLAAMMAVLKGLGAATSDLPHENPPWLPPDFNGHFYVGEALGVQRLRWVAVKDNMLFVFISNTHNSPLMRVDLAHVALIPDGEESEEELPGFVLEIRTVRQRSLLFRSKSVEAASALQATLENKIRNIKFLADSLAQMKSPEIVEEGGDTGMETDVGTHLSFEFGVGELSVNLCESGDGVSPANASSTRGLCTAVMQGIQISADYSNLHRALSFKTENISVTDNVQKGGPEFRYLVQSGSPTDEDSDALTSPLIHINYSCSAHDGINVVDFDFSDLRLSLNHSSLCVLTTALHSATLAPPPSPPEARARTSSVTDSSRPRSSSTVESSARSRSSSVVDSNHIPESRSRSASTAEFASEISIDAAPSHLTESDLLTDPSFFRRLILADVGEIVAEKIRVEGNVKLKVHARLRELSLSFNRDIDKHRLLLVSVTNCDVSVGLRGGVEWMAQGTMEDVSMITTTPSGDALHLLRRRVPSENIISVTVRRTRQKNKLHTDAIVELGSVVLTPIQCVFTDLVNFVEDAADPFISKIIVSEDHPTRPSISARPDVEKSAMALTRFYVAVSSPRIIFPRRCGPEVVIADLGCINIGNYFELDSDFRTVPVQKIEISISNGSLSVCPSQDSVGDLPLSYRMLSNFDVGITVIKLMEGVSQTEIAETRVAVEISTLDLRLERKQFEIIHHVATENLAARLCPTRQQTQKVVEQIRRNRAKVELVANTHLERTKLELSANLSRATFTLLSNTSAGAYPILNLNLERLSLAMQTYGQNSSNMKISISRITIFDRRHFVPGSKNIGFAVLSPLHADERISFGSITISPLSPTPTLQRAESILSVDTDNNNQIFFEFRTDDDKSRHINFFLSGTRLFVAIDLLRNLIEFGLVSPPSTEEQRILDSFSETSPSKILGWYFRKFVAAPPTPLENIKIPTEVVDAASTGAVPSGLTSPGAKANRARMLKYDTTLTEDLFLDSQRLVINPEMNDLTIDGAGHKIYFSSHNTGTPGGGPDTFDIVVRSGKTLKFRKVTLVHTDPIESKIFLEANAKYSANFVHSVKKKKLSSEEAAALFQSRAPLSPPATSGPIIAASTRTPTFTQPKQSPTQPSDPICLKIRLLHPEIFLSEDIGNSQENEQADVVKAFAVQVDLTVEYLCGENGARKITVLSNLTSAASISVCPKTISRTDDLGNEFEFLTTKIIDSPLPILHPLAFSLSLTDSISKDGSIEQAATISIETLQLHFSFQDYKRLVNLFLAAKEKIIPLIESLNPERDSPASAQLPNAVQPVRSLSVDGAEIQLTLTDDCQGRNQPMLLLQLAEVTVFANDSGNSSQKIMVQSKLQVTVYNLKHAAWEPLVEVWPFAITLQNSLHPDGKRNTELGLQSSERLNLNVTHTALVGCNFVLSSWQQDLKQKITDEGTRVLLTSHVIENRTGHTCTLRTDPSLIEFSGEELPRVLATGDDFSFNERGRGTQKNESAGHNLYLDRGRRNLSRRSARSGSSAQTLISQVKFDVQIEFTGSLIHFEDLELSVGIQHIPAKSRPSGSWIPWLVCEISLIEGRKHISLGSIFEIENTLQSPISIQHFPSQKTFKIDGGERTYVPIELTQSGHLYLQSADETRIIASEVESSFGYLCDVENTACTQNRIYCIQPFGAGCSLGLTSEALTDAASVIALRKHHIFSPVVSISKDSEMYEPPPPGGFPGAFSVAIYAPFTLKNVLPCDIELRISSASKEGETGTLSLVSVTKLASAESLHVNHLPLNSDIYIEICVSGSGGGWSWTQPLCILGSTKILKTTEVVTFRNDRGNRCLLSVSLSPALSVSPACPFATELEISCSHWIVNHTNIPLAVTAANKIMSDSDTHISHCDANSVSMFSPAAAKSARISLLRSDPGSRVHSDKFSIVTVATAGELTIEDPRGRVDLAVKISMGSGVFSAIKIITITPRYIVVNQTQFTLLVRQNQARTAGMTSFGGEDDGAEAVLPNEQIPFHWQLGGSQIRKLQVSFAPVQEPRSEQCVWCWSSGLSMDSVGELDVKIKRTFIGGVSEYVAHVDIQAEGSTTVFIVRPQSGSLPYLFRNETSARIRIRQYGVGSDWLYIAPSSSIGYAWDEQTSSRRIEVEVGDIVLEKTFDPNSISTHKPRPCPQLGSGNIHVWVRHDGMTKVMTMSENPLPKSRGLQGEDDESVETSIKLDLCGFGVSVIDHTTKEILWLTVSDIKASFEVTESELRLLLSVAKMQIDNQVTDIPNLAVTLAPHENNVDFFQLSFVGSRRENSGGWRTVQYLCILIQEIDIKLNDTLIFNLLHFVSKVQEESAGDKLRHRNALFSQNLISNKPFETLTRPVAVSAVYIRLLHFHPIKISVTLTTTHTLSGEGRGQGTFSNTVGLAIPNIDNATIRLSGIVLKHAVANNHKILINRLVSHYTRQCIIEGYKLVGSVDLLGNPVGLVTTLGNGVFDFFYEPSKGLVKSPKDFAKGVGKGTASLVSKSVYGAMNTVTRVTSSIGSGFAAAGMDDDFIHQRQMQQGVKAAHIGHGLMQGSLSLGRGIALGIAGIALQPYKGAKKEGAKGFFKGVGKGLIGVATKPVAGALDMASKTTEGIQNTATFLTNSVTTTRDRIPRAVNPDHILTAFRWEDAWAQILFSKTKSPNFIRDGPVTLCACSNDQILVLSPLFCVLAKSKSSPKPRFAIAISDIKSLSDEGDLSLTISMKSATVVQRRRLWEKSGPKAHTITFTTHEGKITALAHITAKQTKEDDSEGPASKFWSPIIPRGFVSVVVYETQKRKTWLTDFDSTSNFSDECGCSLGDLKSISPPENWRWEGEWTLRKSVAPDGWMYSENEISFDKFKLKNSTIRRRAWERVRMATV